MLRAGQPAGYASYLRISGVSQVQEIQDAVFAALG
jgi:hypothetical protein